MASAGAPGSRWKGLGSAGSPAASRAEASSAAPSVAASSRAGASAGPEGGRSGSAGRSPAEPAGPPGAGCGSAVGHSGAESSPGGRGVLEGRLGPGSGSRLVLEQGQGAQEEALEPTLVTQERGELGQPGEGGGQARLGVEPAERRARRQAVQDRFEPLGAAQLPGRGGEPLDEQGTARPVGAVFGEERGAQPFERGRVLARGEEMDGGVQAVAERVPRGAGLAGGRDRAARACTVQPGGSALGLGTGSRGAIVKHRGDPDRGPTRGRCARSFY